MNDDPDCSAEHDTDPLDLVAALVSDALEAYVERLAEHAYTIQKVEGQPSAEDLANARALMLETGIEMFMEDGPSREEAETRARALIELPRLLYL